ncbi:MAG: IS110 family transposase [Nitrosomonadales bacterium]
MNKFSKYVGLDVHKETIAVSVAEGQGGEVRYVGEIANTEEELGKLVKQLRKGNANLSFCYEAGPCGYGIHRQLTDLGWDCQVVAPSLIPKKAGDRIKTDRRDSLMLARLHRAGELTAVWVPDGAQEALRDLTRAREDMKHLQIQVRQRLLGFLLRHGRRYDGKTKWTLTHYRWMETVKFEHAVQQIVFQEYIDMVKAMNQHIEALDKQIESAAGESVFWPVIEGLMALRGVSLLTATTIVAELGDLRRFASAPQLMAYLGLVPSEHSSGSTKSRGGITKTGNGHVRRLLVEAGWTYRHPARKTATLQRRAEKASDAVQEIAWKAQTRLCGRYRKLEARGKLRVQTCTAIARELTGFIWAIGQTLPNPVART